MEGAPHGDGASRIPGLDALRGIAVVLMLEQHLGFWWWQRPPAGGDVPGWLVGINALGGLAAPVFVTLAGAGCALMAASGRPQVDRTLFGRGVALLVLGYALNLVTPAWFSWGSWYVLHLIGAALVLTPLVRRARTSVLLALLAAVLAATPLIQWWLRTPARLFNERMRDVSLPGGVLRLALAEGQFPLLPWLAAHLAGLAAGRWLVEGRVRRAVVMGVACLACAVPLGAAHVFDAGLPHTGIAGHVVTFRTGFYPASTVTMLALTGTAVLAIAGAAHLWRRGVGRAAAWLVPLGRSSLTILIAHVVLFRQLAPMAGLSRNVGAAWTAAMTAGAIALCAALAHLWRRADYRYGAEWFVREVGRR